MVGYGVVGSATGTVLGQIHDIIPYDRYKSGLQDTLGRLASEAEVTFICVPTPMRANGSMDYSAIRASLESLLHEVMKCGRDPESLIAVVRSTAVSGTTDYFAQHFPFRFAFSPEFLREKHAETDMRSTSRVIIGANRKDVHTALVALYQAVFPEAHYICVDIKTAEMIKYAANIALAGQIAIANELCRICAALDIDYAQVKTAIQLDERIGRNMDVPGHDGKLGFGGKCFPKDLRGLIALARDNHLEPNLLNEIWRSNLDVRKEQDWLEICGATTENNFDNQRV